MGLKAVQEADSCTQVRATAWGTDPGQQVQGCTWKHSAAPLLWGPATGTGVSSKVTARQKAQVPSPSSCGRGWVAPQLSVVDSDRWE